MDCDLYLLIHPETQYVEQLELFTGADVDLSHLSHDEYDAELKLAYRQWGEAVAQGSSGARVRAAVLYDEPEQAHEDVLPTVSIEGWQWLEADGFTVVHAAQQLAQEALTQLGLDEPGGAKCFIAGTARHDCVARVAEHMASLGWSVGLHEAAVLPPER